MKRLLPSLRENQRYLVFEIIGGEVDFDDLKNKIWEKALQFMGEKGCADASPKLVKKLFKGDKGVVRVDNDKVGEMKTSLALVRRINKSRVILKTIRLCGTLDNCEEVLKKVS